MKKDLSQEEGNKFLSSEEMASFNAEKSVVTGDKLESDWFDSEEGEHQILTRKDLIACLILFLFSVVLGFVVVQYFSI